MNAEVFAKWLRRQGHTIIRTESSYWVDYGPRTYQGFPYHWVIDIPQRELDEFLRKNRGLGLRYSAPVESKYGQISYHAVFENEIYGIDTLGKWARKNVRRGLRNCNVEPISFQRLANEGWELQVDTLLRQNRDLDVSKQVWHQRCAAASDLDGFEAWGAIVDTRLAASVITFQMEDCIYMLYQQCHSDFLSAHVNNALSFVVTETMVSRPGIKSILYGLHSLDAPASVDEFKFRMGYTARPVRQRVVFHPWLTPLFNSATYGAVRNLQKRQPDNPNLAKAEGMMRFYLEGRQPLAEQEWPEVLDKQALLESSSYFVSA
ncbi:hypothetical protein KC887_03220 [Candidatus Kaiserbacteria bacterium]|nr:hypothetical protein [Candidatus Kaiserbacteria bacterium]